MSGRAVSSVFRDEPHRGRRSPIAVVAVALLAGIVLLLAVAGPAAAEYRSRDDWRHVDEVVAALNHDPPSGPVVLLLGGSAARESITTEPDWRRQIAAHGGGRVSAYNLGASSQRYQDGLEIVDALPAVPTLVLIGVNLGRYTTIPPEDVGTARGTRGVVYDSHRFHDGQQLSDRTKRALVARWLRKRYPVFRERYAGNARTLEALIALCQERGFCPVLVELPINLAIVRHALDAPRGRYRSGCRAAAREAGIPYEDFTGRIGLVSHDFRDFAHLVEPGRVKYQHRLSQFVVAKLRQYGLIGRGSAAAVAPAAP